jgi:hypothetical protein
MIKSISVLLVVFLPLFISCTNNPLSESQNESYGFTIRVYYSTYPTDSVCHISIGFGNIYDTLPIIKINGNIIDSGYTSNSIYYSINQINIGKINYEIIFKGDTLNDTIRIPNRIDSIYCNGVLLRDSLVVWIDSSNVYEFAWKSNNNINYYNIDCWSSFSGESQINTKDTTFLFTPLSVYNAIVEGGAIYSGGHGGFYLFCSEYNAITSNSKPNKRNGKLFAYYEQIYGPCRHFDFAIKKP